MKNLKFLIIPLLIVMLLGFGMNSFAELHSKWTAGELVYYDATNTIFAIRNDAEGLRVYDDMPLTFGDDGDATITYDETTDNILEIVCANGISINAFMDWGTADTGIALTTANPFAIEVHAEPLTVLTAGDTGLSCALRARYHVSVAQTNSISIGAIDARLRVKHALAGGNHYGLNAGIEASTTDADFTGITSTMRSGAHIYLDFSADVTLADDGYLTILTLDNSVDDGMVGGVDNVQFAGMRIKEGSSGMQDLEHGIILDDDVAVIGIGIGACTTGISFTGALASAAISMDGATFAAGDNEIEMRNTITGDKTIIASGSAANDGAIVTAVGADADIADGSLYLQVIDGQGVLYIKKNDVWTAFTNP